MTVPGNFFTWKRIAVAATLEEPRKTLPDNRDSHDSTRIMLVELRASRNSPFMLLSNCLDWTEVARRRSISARLRTLKGFPASFATARAAKLFPVPFGPAKTTHFDTCWLFSSFNRCRPTEMFSRLDSRNKRQTIIKSYNNRSSRSGLSERLWFWFLDDWYARKSD